MIFRSKRLSWKKPISLGELCGITMNGLRMDDDKRKQLWLEILTTLLVIVLYWISTQPEWKLEMYLRWLTEKLPRPVRESREQLSHTQKEILARFRQEISEWEHKRASGKD